MFTYPISGGGSSYVVTAKRFVLSTTNYYRGGVGNMFPAPGGTAVTRVVSWYPTAHHSGSRIFDSTQIAGYFWGQQFVSGAPSVYVTQGDVRYSGGVGGYVATATHPQITLNTWHTMGFSINYTTGVLTYFYDGTYNASWYTEDAPPSKTLENFSTKEEFMGTDRLHGLGAFSPCDISQYWCDDSYIDFSSAANVAKFYAAGKPIYLGANGELPTGGQPLHFNPNGDMTNNLGSQANWIEVGTVPDAPTSPTD